jgi:hypothetical protein
MPRNAFTERQSRGKVPSAVNLAATSADVQWHLAAGTDPVDAEGCRMLEPEQDWRRAVGEIRRLTGAYLNRTNDTARLEGIAAAIGFDPATVDRALQGAGDPHLLVAARLARHAGGALVAVPSPWDRSPAVAGSTRLVEPASEDVAAIQSLLRRLRSATGLALPAFALASGMPLGPAAAAETGEGATLAGAAAFAAHVGLSLRIVGSDDVAAVRSSTRDLGAPPTPPGPIDVGDADADVDWIRRSMEEALAHTRLDAASLARRVHLPEAVSRDAASCRIVGPFKTTASLAAGLGYRLAAVDRSERDQALVDLGASLCTPSPPPGLSPRGARNAVRLQERQLIETVLDRRRTSGTAQRSVQEIERGLMPVPIQRIARHVEALGLALVLRAA